MEVGLRVTSVRPVEVQSIKFLGTTWQRRGFRYWMRRTGLLVLWSGVCAVSMWVVAILFGVVATDSDTSVVTRTVALSLMSMAVIGSFIWGFSLLRRSEEEKKLGVPMIMRSGSTVEDRQRAAWSGYGLGLVAAPLIVVSQMFVVGVAVAIVVSLTQKYISIEEFEAATGRKAPRRYKKRSRWSRRR